MKHLSGSGSDSGSLTVLNLLTMNYWWLILWEAWHDMTTGYLDFCISGFLDFCLSGILQFYNALPLTSITVIVAVFLEKWWFFTPILSLLSMCSQQLKKSDCNLARMSQPTRSGSTILADNDSPCVIHNIGTMQANFDAQSCEICHRKTGWKNWFGLSSRTLFTKTF